MKNPWKVSTLVLAAALFVSSARAAPEWKQDALGKLEAAAQLIAANAGGGKGKQAPTERSPDKKTDASPAYKALQLVRAAIVQLKRASAE